MSALYGTRTPIIKTVASFVTFSRASASPSSAVRWAHRVLSAGTLRVKYDSFSGRPLHETAGFHGIRPRLNVISFISRDRGEGGPLSSPNDLLRGRRLIASDQRLSLSLPPSFFFPLERFLLRLEFIFNECKRFKSVCARACVERVRLREFTRVFKAFSKCRSRRVKFVLSKKRSVRRGYRGLILRGCPF